MIRNILLSAIASLKRKKMASLFTILTISLGMTMIVLSLAIYQSFTGNVGPYKQRDKCLFLSKVSFQLDGKTVERDFLKYSTASFINNHLGNLKTPRLIGLYQPSDKRQVDLGSAYKKVTLKYMVTDANFWKILQFSFLAGRPFNSDEVNQRARVCVISRRAAEIIFSNVHAVGKIWNNYRIVGVIEDEHPRFEIAADIYMPYTIAPIDESVFRFEEYYNRNVYPYRGSFKAIVLANRKSDIKIIQNEFDQLVHKLNEQGNVEEFDAINADLKTTSQLIPEFFQSFELSSSLFAVLFVLIFLLPIIILSNINQHALSGRMEEIGLRRAFGIKRRSLFLHFLAENILISFLGCLVALAMSVPLFRLLSWVIFQTPHGVDFPFDWNAVIYLILGIFVFGFLTGVVPIINTSGINSVKAIQNISDEVHFPFSLKIYQKGVRVFTYFLLFVVLAISCSLISFYYSVTISSLGYNIKNQLRIRVIEEVSNIIGNEPKQVENFSGLKERLMHIDGIESVAYMLGPCPMDVGTQPAIKSFLIDGDENQCSTLQVDTSFFDALQIKPRKGKFFNGQDLSGKYLPAVVTLAAENELFAGEAMGKTFQLKETEKWYKVTGVIAKYKHGSGLKPLSAIILCRNKPSLDLIIRYKPTSNLLALGNSTDSLIKNQFVACDVRALKDDYLSQTQKTVPMFYGMLLVTGFILLNALFGYFTLSYYNVIGRKKEIGIRRSMGANKFRIYLQIVIESLISMSLGTILAVLAVYQLKLFLLNGYVWDYFNSGLYLAIGISFITTIATSLYPAYIASKVQPVEALAEE